MDRRLDPGMAGAEHIDTAIQFVPRNIRRIGDVPPSSASASFARAFPGENCIHFSRSSSVMFCAALDAVHSASRKENASKQRCTRRDRRLHCADDKPRMRR
jgi:hypothetical protein